MYFKKIQRPDEATLQLIRNSASDDLQVALAAQYEIAKALETPLRQGILVGDVVRGIFEARQYSANQDIRFPLDLLAPGEEKEHVAYTIPGHGRIPERQVEGDYVQINTYAIANSIDWLLRFAAQANYDVVGRAMQVLEAGFVKKINDDGWHTIITAGTDRNILVFDGDASAGQFTKRLVSLMKVLMVRSGGGNTASIKRRKLTDLYVSHECVEDMRNWGLDQIDEVTRREYFMLPDETVPRLFQVNIHPMDEFGENQEYQDFFTDVLGGSLQASDLELVVGLDRGNNDSFIMPIDQEITLFPDTQLHRSQKAGVYGWGGFGFGVLDGRSVILGSC